MNIKTLTKSLFYSAFLWFSVAEVSAQKTQKIGDNPYSIDSKAVLELESTTKGFLPPRMTTAQMNAITSPTEGMIVYCTDCGVNTDGELRIAYNSVWQTFKGDLTGNVTGTSANVTGVVAAANGGTGAATLTGYVKGNGTSTMTASATIPVADVSGAAPLASPTFTGTVTGVTSTMVGLGNVNNTSDASKPVSTATQTALDLKAPLASPTFTGTPSLPTGTTGVTQSASDNSTKLATTAYADAQATAAVSGKQSTLTNSAGLSGALSDETGTGLAVFATSPTLVTPNLGTPSTLVGTNITGTASGLTAGAVTTNANLTGEVTSTGNATTVTAAAGGHGMIVVQWAVPPTARADTASGGTAMAITKNPATNDTGSSGATIAASSVRLCGSGDIAPNCTATLLTASGEGTYSVNTSTGVVTFTGVAGFVGTSTVTYSVADTRGTKASSTISFTTLAPPTARPDESAAAKGDNQSVSPLANDSAAGTATLSTSSLRLCEVTETPPTCTKTAVIVANEGRYDISAGVVTFTANASYTGTRILRYIVQDSNTQVATDTITFIALPPPAVSASADSRTVAHTVTASFTPLSNDSAGVTPSDYTTQGTVAFNTSTLKLCAASETISTGCTRNSIDVTDQGTWTLTGTTVKPYSIPAAPARP